MRLDLEHCCRGTGFVGQNRIAAPDWTNSQQGPTVSLTESALLSRKIPSTFLQSNQRTSPISPLPQLHAAAIALPSSQTPITSFSMFRNALRQSTRAVGAVTAASRVSVVSYSSAPDRTEPAIEPRRKTACIHQKNVLGVQLGC